MTPKLPNVDKDARYTLAETASILEVSPSTIIRWTRAGKIQCRYRKVNHRPIWTGEEILRAWKSIV